MSKYYYESSITTILSKEGREVIDLELEKLKPVCDICGTELIRISMMEGDCIICPKEMYIHPIYYDIIMDRKEINLPKLKKRKLYPLNLDSERCFDDLKSEG